MSLLVVGRWRRRSPMIGLIASDVSAVPQRNRQRATLVLRGRVELLEIAAFDPLLAFLVHEPESLQ